MITYDFLASTPSNILGGFVGIGWIIGSILLIIILSVICCITVIISRKYHKRRRNANIQQFELQTTRSPRTTQTTNRTPSRPLPNTTFNTIPQTWNQYSSYVTESEHYPEGNIRPPPPYNPHYHQQSADYLAPFSNLSQPSAPPHSYRNPTVNTLQSNQSREASTMIEPPPPSYAELFEN